MAEKAIFQPLWRILKLAHSQGGADSYDRIQCQWCQSMNQKTALSCRACGAPLDIRNLVSESGWREAPRIRDMTEIHFSASTCQVEGEIVPVAEINLGAGRFDLLRAPRHAVEGRAAFRSTRDAALRRPEAGLRRHAVHHQRGHRAGPHRVFARRHGELVVLPLHPGMELDVREHAFLLCVAPDRLFVRAHQRPRQYSVRRPGHVHGSLRHRPTRRAC